MAATALAQEKAAPAQQYKKRSPLREVWRRLKKNKGAMAGLIIIVLLVVLACSADLFYDYNQDAVEPNIVNRLQSPSFEHPFGTDDLGRDILARVIFGSRVSLAVGVVAVMIALVIGVTLGAAAGYFGGMTENIIMRLTDIFLSIPSILLSIAIVAALGQSMLNLMIAVGVSSTPAFVRIARGAVMTVRNQEFVEASRAVGVSNWRIIASHILPNSLSPIIVQATLRVASAIVSASGLSFLGLGVPPPAPEWGGMLSAGRAFIRDYSYMTLFPGLAIMITVLALNLLGDGLRDAIDPKLKQ